MSVRNRLLCSLFSPDPGGLAVSVWPEAATVEDFLLLAMHFVVTERPELLPSVVHHLDDQGIDRLVDLILFVGLTRNSAIAFAAMQHLSRLTPARPALWSAFALLQVTGGHLRDAWRSLTIHAAITGRTIDLSDAAPVDVSRSAASVQIVRGDVDMWA